MINGILFGVASAFCIVHVIDGAYMYALSQLIIAAIQVPLFMMRGE